MILILFCFILNECSGSARYNSVSPYQTFLTAPYWTYPVKKEPLIHRPSYFSNFQHLRFKRETEDHEFPKDIPTKPNQENKESWAKGKIPGKEVDIGFVPYQLYTQVRRYDTVKHLPRSAALEEAKTDEEIAAAPRLREVLSHKKIQQVYEEEGFEDSGYDHGGYNHQGAKYEDNEKNEDLDSKHEDPQIRGAEEVLVYTNPNGKYDSPMIGSFKNQITVSNKKSSKYDDGDEISVLLEEAPPKVRKEKYVLVDGRRVPIYKNKIKNDKYMPESEERSREKLEESRESVEMIETAQSRSGVVDDEAEVRVVNDPRPKGSNTVTFPGRHTRRQYAIGRLTENWSPMAPADVFVQESVGYNVRRPFYPGVPVTHNVHHYVPLVPFPNFYSDNPTYPLKVKPRPSTQFSSASTLNTFSQLVSSNETTTTTTTTTTLPPIVDPKPNKTDYIDIIQPRFNFTIDLERPNRINFGRGRHYNNFTRHNTPRGEQTRQPNWNFNRHLLNIRHPSLPRDNKDDDIRPFAGALKSEPEARFYENGPVKYIEQLTVAHYSSLENKPLKNPPNNQTGRLIALARELNARAKMRKKRDASVSYDAEKYPFYRKIAGREKGNRDSALKYATNPDQIPKKTGAMDFYDSKDKLVKCDEPNLPEDIVPEREEDGEWNKNPQPEMPRLKGLGDMIQCNKNKYFGKEPLDNPFFQEDIEPPKYETDDEIENQKPLFNKKRKGENTKRLIVLTKPENGTKHKNYSNHKMNNVSVVFPYKNHKPEAEATNLRIATPYSYYNNPENHYSIYENPEEGDSYTESSLKHHHYRPPYYPYRHKHHKRKRFRPNRQPVSIYSIISHNGYPNYYNRPLILAHSMNTNKIIPLYPVGTTTQSTDNVASDTEEFPTKYYIIRPGEFTENKDLAADKKETSSIWSYMNPLNRLRWWFPSLFDNRRKEPKYRKRRDSEFEDDEMDHKPQTTGPPISMSEFKMRMNISENAKPQMRGGYRNYATEPTTRTLEAPTEKPKVLFPRTKTPMRKPISYNIPTEAKYVPTTTTVPPTTTKMSRMYKPKRIVDKSFRKPIDAFDVLKRPKTESPRRTQVEHRRVTKEEVYKTSFVPDKSGEISEPPENKTLTYMVNTETGVGTWKEEPRGKKRKWRPKKKKLKNEETKTRTSPKRSVKRQREIADDEAYILGLMSKLPTPDWRYYPKKPKISKSEMSEEVETKIPTHFIVDPGKRKYYYVND